MKRINNYLQYYIMNTYTTSDSIVATNQSRFISKKISALLFSLICVITLAACAGGGGGGVQATNFPTGVSVLNLRIIPDTTNATLSWNNPNADIASISISYKLQTATNFETPIVITDNARTARNAMNMKGVIDEGLLTTNKTYTFSISLELKGADESVTTSAVQVTRLIGPNLDGDEYADADPLRPDEDGGGGIVPDDTTMRPFGVTELEANPGILAVTLSWNNPDADIESINISYQRANLVGERLIKSSTKTTRAAKNVRETIIGLTNGQTYNFTVSLTLRGDDADKEVVEASAIATPGVFSVTRLTALAGPDNVTLSWNNPNTQIASINISYEIAGSNNVQYWDLITNPAQIETKAQNVQETIDNLTNEGTYIFTVSLTLVDTNLNKVAIPRSVSTTLALLSVTALKATLGKDIVTLSWNNPAADIERINIRYGDREALSVSGSVLITDDRTANGRMNVQDVIRILEDFNELYYNFTVSLTLKGVYAGREGPPASVVLAVGPDYDGDNIADFVDPDENGDGEPDKDFDGDGIHDFRDPDASGNGRPNRDSDGDTIFDYLDINDDNDAFNDDVDIDDDGDGLIEIGSFVVDGVTYSDIDQVRNGLDGNFLRRIVPGMDVITGRGCGGACNGYELIEDISIHGNWDPIGECRDYNTATDVCQSDEFYLFKAIFEGNGWTISHFTINTGGVYANAAGFFGALSSNAVIRNVNIRSASINGGRNNVGLLAGYAGGANIRNSSVEGVVTATTGDNVGGLVGNGRNSIITSSYADGTVTVSGDDRVGGLVGFGENAMITSSYAESASVSGTFNIGALLGSGSGTIITSSYAKGVTVSGTSNIGALLGEGDDATISLSYAINGRASGTNNNVGGLVGFGIGSNITLSYIAGMNVNGKNNVGGLVGRGVSSTITSSYAVNGSAIGTGDDVGGLVGEGADATILLSHAVGMNINGDENVGGLLGEGTNADIMSSRAENMNISGSENVGGLVGEGTNSDIKSSYAEVEDVIGSGGSIGGLLGNGASARITSSYAQLDSIEGTSSIGGLVGYGANAVVNLSYAEVGSIAGSDTIGGLVGKGARTRITSSYAQLDSIEGTSSIGGLLGEGTNAVVTSSYAEVGNVMNVQQSTGGLVGFVANNIANYVTIKSSYAKVGSITLGNNYYGGIGGLVGDGSNTNINSSYSVVGFVTSAPGIGGLVGRERFNQDIDSSYWNNETRSITQTIGNKEGVAADAAQTSVTLVRTIDFTEIYANWVDDVCDDGSRAWDLNSNQLYPALTCTPNGSPAQIYSPALINPSDPIPTIPGGFAVTDLTAITSETSVTLSWTNPDADIKSIDISYRRDGSDLQEYYSTRDPSRIGRSATNVQHVISDLITEASYNFTVDLTLGTDDEDMKGVPPSVYVVIAADADKDGVVDSLDDDRDGDGLVDDMDRDDDGNGLIEIATAAEFNQVRDDLTGRSFAGNTNGCGGLNDISVCSGYELVANISLDGYDDWTPIGSCDGITKATSVKPEFCAPENKFFNTIFDGNGHTISDLTITSAAGIYANAAGLFGAIGPKSILRNVHLRSASISGGVKNVGLLVGYAHYGGATIMSSSAGGNVTASSSNVGGLVGSGRDDHNSNAVVAIGSNIISSYVTGVSVRGVLRVGGLIGDGRGAVIASSYAEVDSVSGSRAISNTDVGGLVGRGERVAISSSYVTGGTVMGGSNSVGGLLGYGIGATITTSYVQDVSVSGLNSIGGLLGQGQNAIITSSYVGNGVTLSATGAGDSGNGNAGGLVGSGRGVTIKTSYSAAGSISADNNGNTGGLVGFGTVKPASSNSYWDREASGITGGSVAGKITGLTTAQLQSLNSFYYGTWNDRCADGSRAWNFGTDMQYPALTCTPGGLVAQGFESNTGGGGLVDSQDPDRDGDGLEDDTDVDDDGNGLIEIATADELDQIRRNLLGSGNIMGCGGTTTGIDRCNGYELVANISLASYTNWIPIGSCDRITDATSLNAEFCAPETSFFNTIFDGNGYTISDLTITSAAGIYANAAGLFGAIGSNSIVRNVHLRSASISDGVKNVGLLVGYAHYGGATIMSSSAGGDVTASSSNVGGLVGSGRNNRNPHAILALGSNIISSYVTGVSVSGRLRVGGLIGDGRGAAITSSYAEVDSVSGSRAIADSDVGGLVGQGERAAIISSYVTGRTVMGGSNNVGGLVGYGIGATITTSYVQDVSVSGSNNIGGLLGQGQNAIITSSYVGDGVTLSAAGVGGNGNAGGLLGAGDDVTIKTSYSAAGSISANGEDVGGLVASVGVGGAINPASSNSYWDSQTSGITGGSVAGKIEARTTAQLINPTSSDAGIYSTWKDRCASGFPAWDFGTTSEYPALTCTPGGAAAQRP